MPSKWSKTEGRSNKARRIDTMAQSDKLFLIRVSLVLRSRGLKYCWE